MDDGTENNLEIFENNLVPVLLPSGRRAAVSVFSLGGEEQVSAKVPDFSAVLDSIREMSGAVVQAVDKIPGKKVTIEFGLAFGLESGQLITLFAKAAVNASLKITIELSSDGAATDGAATDGEAADPDETDDNGTQV